jgi:pilus assembly protein Flp/PilA
MREAWRSRTNAHCSLGPVPFDRFVAKPFVYLSAAFLGRRIQRGPTMSKFLKLIRNEKGATAIEYGLIAALIAVAAIAAMSSVGSKLGDTFNNVSADLETN